MNKKKLLMITTSSLMCLTLVLTGCKAKQENTANNSADTNATASASDFSGVPPIYATIAPVYDFTRKIAGNRQRAELIVKSDIHDYEPSAAEMARLEKSPMIIYNGMELDSFVRNINENLNIKFIDTSMGIQAASYNTQSTVNGYTGIYGTHHEEYHDGHGHDHGSINYPSEAEFNRYATSANSSDPHVWLYPLNAKIQLRNIKDALCEYDGENAEYYNANYETYAAKCDELDAKFKTLAGKTIITSHNAYTYWQEKYGINIMAMDTGGEEVSPARMREIVDHCKNNSITVVYYEAGGSSKTAEAVAKEIGGTTKALNSFESIVDNKDDYFTIMEENYEALK